MTELKIYLDKDIDKELIKSKKIAVIGFGSQGYGQSMNLKDSGCDVVLGLRQGGASDKKAKNYGFKTMTIEDAVKWADIIQVLIPDEVQQEVYEKQIKPAKYGKEDLPNLKDWGRVGLFAGGQQFLDNIIYALMICRMVNAVAESGNYWVSNNFIWGWLLIPVTCLVEIIRKDAGADGYNLRQKNYYSIITFVLLAWFALIPTYQWFFGTVEGIENPVRIFEIVVKNLGFYVAYAYSQVPDAIFVGMGKTKYNAVNSLICNIVYYGIWFILYKTGVVVMSMDMIIVMFGCGNVTHWAVSLVEEKVFLKKELQRMNRETLE